MRSRDEKALSTGYRPVLALLRRLAVLLREAGVARSIGVLAGVSAGAGLTMLAPVVLGAGVSRISAVSDAGEATMPLLATATLLPAAHSRRHS